MRGQVHEVNVVSDVCPVEGDVGQQFFDAKLLKVVVLLLQQ